MATLTKKTLLVAELKTVFDGLKEDANNAALRAADIILEKALPLTPMKTGALRESGRIEERENGEVAVVFGNDDTINYAAIVHEDMSPKTFTESGTGPKFLEIAVDQSMNEIDEMFANTVEMRLHGREK